MKCIALLVVFAVVIFAPIAHAQNHAEVGAFVDYFQLHQTSTNFVGVGGRAAINVMPHVQIEAEMAYDFSQAYTQTFNNGTGTVHVANSNFTVLHGLFGPKFQTRGPVRVFATVKGGFANFRFAPGSASFAGFTGSINNLTTNNVDAALYPGGGVEAYLGPFGLRAEAGDEIIFANGGTYNNWKVTFGPTFRF